MEDAPITTTKTKKGFWAKIFAILTIIFMAGWALALYAEREENQSGEKIQLADHTFYRLKDGTYATIININNENKPIAFYLDPREASGIFVSAEAKNLLKSNKVYITFNPNQKNLSYFGIAGAQISRIFALYNIPVVGAYTEDTNPIDPNVPIKTCEDANNLTAIIELKIGNSTEIMRDKQFLNCYYIMGKNETDLIYAADRLGYLLLGINL
ncbi:MAG: hypothetical protein QW625_01950 [Candidatus Nanoarchaeia archaeon]